MKQKKSISAPRKGMNSDTHITQLKNTDYTLAVNVNSSNENGDGQIIQNEPSNTLGVLFPATYKVIGFVRNSLKERTYYFLTSTESNINSVNYKRSSIGYVNDTILDTFNIDTPVQGCTDCENPKNELGVPLENIIQTPSQVYVELVNDRCISVSDIEEMGLNFSINSPIKKIEIKQEKLGTTLYWNDWRNYYRYLQIGSIEESKEKLTFDYLHSEDIACDDPQETACLNVEKLLVFPRHTRIKLEASQEQIGGNLKQGTYEFWAAYCDTYGNEITEYSTPTNPISIWDENNYIQSQTTTDEFTNYAIKLKVHNLDKKRFKYYKVAVVERNNVGNTQSVFLAGIYPTIDDIVVYTHSGSSNDDLYITRGNNSVKKRMDFNTLTAVKPTYKRMKGTMVSDDRLFGFGIEEEEEINVQPVVNLFSSLVKWSSTASTEMLYKSPVANSKYKGYQRGEVQPFAIRLLYNDGGYSANFPFIGRPKTEDDAEIVDTLNKNRKSLEEASSACSTSDRTEKWEIFNTATVLGDQVCGDIYNQSTVSTDEEVEKFCLVDIEDPVPSNFLEIGVSDPFYGLENYINTHASDICNVASSFYDAFLCGYISGTYLETCDANFFDNCTTPVLTDTAINVKQVIGEVKTFVPKILANYVKSIIPSQCNPYRRNVGSAGFMQDTVFMNSFSKCNVIVAPPGFEKTKVFFRDSYFDNENCSIPKNLLEQSNPTQSLASYFLNYDASLTLSDLTLNNATFPATVSSGFAATLHNKAQFFKVSKNNRDTLMLEFTKKSNCLGVGDLFDTVVINNEIRYTIYDDCVTPTILGTGIVDLSAGALISLDVTAFQSTFLVAIDSKIISQNIELVCGSPLQMVHFIAPPCGCFGFYARNQEYSKLRVDWDSINLSKKLTYKSTCTFTIPKVNDCDPIPYKRGKMAFWESIIEYPDNKELYDSSVLKIRPSDLVNIEADDKIDFEQYFTDGVDVDGNYEWKLDVSRGKKVADFRCDKIKHFKFPDNTVSPFITDNLAYKGNADSTIFPLGISIDSNIVRTMLEVAYNNNLITEKQKNKVTGWEILRGDNTIHKSVIANGISSDVNNYTKNFQKINFSNFPFNDQGLNNFCINPITFGLIAPEVDKKLFTFFSPDTFLTSPALPTEVSLQGYMLGEAGIGFSDVKNHPKWTVLGDESYDLAEKLAIAELLLEAKIIEADMMKEGWMQFGLVEGLNTGSIIAAASVLLIFAIEGYIKKGKYRYEWLKIFRDLGRADNFATFQYGAGKLNRFSPSKIDDDNYIRRLSLKKYLKDGNYSFIDENDGSKVDVNNWLRETSVLLATGGQPINYTDLNYLWHDNNFINPFGSSNFTSSDIGCLSDAVFQKNIGNPYMALRNYVPDQWDNLDSIKWLTTNNIFDINKDTTCDTILGGTVVISRFSWRKKTPLFTDNAVNTPDKVPFRYFKNSNIGISQYFCDYESADDSDFSFGGNLFPDIRSLAFFDCPAGNDSFYYRPPSKFYLFTHGIVDFLVESEINCNFRYAKKEPKDWFYNNQNLSEWLQEVNLPIKEPNTFYYNNSYSFPVSNTPYKKLDKTYNKEIWKKRAMRENAWIWSEKDVSEDSLVDPWLIHKPLSFWEDKSERGKLIDLRSIESNQFLGRYEDQLQLYNQVSNVADALNSQNNQTGTGFLYNRPISFKKADLGFAGTQNTDFVSTPYGHFWADAKRGRVFQVDQNGGNLEIISESIQGNPSGKKQWFREHLPFKLKKYFPTLDVDNKYKGLGLNFWYDDRNSRVFLTKRDYVPTGDPCLKYSEEAGFYTTCENKECPNGFTYNILTDKCEKITTSLPICPNGYTYNLGNQTCTLTETTPADCNEGIPPIVTNLYYYTISSGIQTNFNGLTKQQVKCHYENWVLTSVPPDGIGGATARSFQPINIGTQLYGYPFPHPIVTSLNGNFLIDIYSIKKILTIVNGVVTDITLLSSLNTCP